MRALALAAQTADLPIDTLVNGTKMITAGDEVRRHKFPPPTSDIFPLLSTLFNMSDALRLTFKVAQLKHSIRWRANMHVTLDFWFSP